MSRRFSHKNRYVCTSGGDHPGDHGQCTPHCYLRAQGVHLSGGGGGGTDAEFRREGR